jgi:hypothetical protein
VAGWCHLQRKSPKEGLLPNTHMIECCYQPVLVYEFWIGHHERSFSLFAGIFNMVKVDHVAVLLVKCLGIFPEIWMSELVPFKKKSWFNSKKKSSSWEEF